MTKHLAHRDWPRLRTLYRAQCCTVTLRETLINKDTHMTLDMIHVVYTHLALDHGTHDAEELQPTARNSYLP